MTSRFLWICMLVHLFTSRVCAQSGPDWLSMPPLPDKEGFAGMFAGVSNNVLICMGGANFPDKRPWEGGTKKWYDGIYVYSGTSWKLLPQKLSAPVAYGVSVSYHNRIILIGGSTGSVHSRKVTGYAWTGDSMAMEVFPELPVPLANMAGTLVNDLVIIAGGTSSPESAPLKKCWALDMKAISKGWFELPPIPGPERTQPVCASYDGRFFLFSGEAPGTSLSNQKFRNILQDAYSFKPVQSGNQWTGEWTKLSPMPKGGSAAGSPLPVLHNGEILLLGGVDGVTAAYKNQATHPGIRNEILLYNPVSDTWNYTGIKTGIDARVTLPVVEWKGTWFFISGEIKPGIRTNTVFGVR